MMINNSMVKSSSEMVNKTDDKTTDNIQTNDEIRKDGEPLSSLMLLLGSILPISTSCEIKQLQECYHDLDKRIAVIEHVLEYIRKG